MAYHYTDMDKNVRGLILGILAFLIVITIGVLIENAQDHAHELAMAKAGMCKQRVPATLTATAYDAWIPCPGGPKPAPETP